MTECKGKIIKSIYNKISSFTCSVFKELAKVLKPFNTQFYNAPGNLFLYKIIMTHKKNYTNDYTVIYFYR
jgi:hypothetical protein